MVGRAIECALGQTHKETDVLVYDDASEDKTRRVVKKYACDRLKYVRGDPCLGECCVRALVAQLVKTDYLAWLDSDDLCNQYRIAVQVAVLNENDAPWCRVDAEVYRKDANIDWREFPRKRERLEFMTPSTMARTEFIKARPHRPYLFGCDTIWELEALRDAKPGLVVHRILYYYMMHDPGRVSKTYPHRPTFEQEMADQRKYRAELLALLEQRGTPYRGVVLDDQYVEEVLKRCYS
jgi:glycosyltransferase involved in cell wall biosynthesis